MKRVVSLQYSSGKVLGTVFQPENRGGVYVGVAVIEDDKAKVFEDRDDFEVEDLDAAEVPSTFPADFPLLAPQRAALARAGLDTLEKVRAHDFEKTKVAGIGGATVATIQKYLAAPAQPSNPPSQEPRDESNRPD